MSGPNLTLRALSPDLADILDQATQHAADPAGIEAFTEDWLINELMRDDPSLTREAAIAQIREGEQAAIEGGF